MSISMTHIKVKRAEAHAINVHDADFKNSSCTFDLCSWNYISNIGYLLIHFVHFKFNMRLNVTPVGIHANTRKFE